MSRTIHLQKATRIEGNADVQIQIEDGRVESARFMVHDFRGFEKMVQGKRVTSVPHMVSRICGLCSIAHQVAGLRAIEDALGVQTPASVRALRQVAIWGEWIASHALSYFFLTLPDALGAGGGVFDLMREYPEVARDAFFLRKSGDRIVEIVGKRPVHAVAHRTSWTKSVASRATFSPQQIDSSPDWKASTSVRHRSPFRPRTASTC
jgi:coenzyme F420-reducing hydrogenase alpha subunit